MADTNANRTEAYPGIEAICDAYESGVGHGMKQDGKVGDYHTSVECNEAYRIGYSTGSSRAQEKEIAPPRWHAPGMGEVHFHDHTLIIDCRREIDSPEQDYVADDGLAKRVSAAMNGEMADARKSLSVMLWLLRRLPQAYGNPPSVIDPIRCLAKQTGIEVDDVIDERANGGRNGEG